MAVWQENLKTSLLQREVLILHGNVRDSAYIRENGTLIPGLAQLIRDTGRELGYQRCVFWGVAFDTEDEPRTPMWSLQRIESFEQDQESKSLETCAEDRKWKIPTTWLAEDIRDVNRKTLFVINYADKLVSYSPHGNYTDEMADRILLIEKIIENISPNNRLLLIALQDTMLPLELYTSSPRTTVMEIPLPDKAERAVFFSRHLAGTGLASREIDLLANLTSGLYARELEIIIRDLLEEQTDGQSTETSVKKIRRVVNRYRIGSEEDPWTQLPLAGPPKGLMDCAETWFRERVIGQDHAVRGVVRAIKKARAAVTGLASGQETKPKAVFFFAGPTGVGKTFLAKQLAEYLFDTQEAFLRFDMSEFKEEHTVSKLIGAPPGYVGYERGGMLTNGVRNHPFSVILFDEIEKADPKIMDIFLQILDDGRLTDSRGQTIFFTESVIIFTSNIGTRSTTGTNVDEKARLEALFQQPDNGKDRQARIRRHFIGAVHDFFASEISRPELLNRIGSQIIAFNFLDSDRVQKQVFAQKLHEMSSHFRDKFSNNGHRLVFEESVTDYFMDKYGSSIKKFGGRGVVNALEDEIGFLIAEQKLWAEHNRLNNITFTVFVGTDGELQCRRAE